MNIAEDENNELEKIAPRLASMKREIPFSVPESYFDEFPMHMQMRIASEKEKGFAASLGRLFEKRRWVPVAFASCIALVFSLILIFSSTNTTKPIAAVKPNTNTHTEELKQENEALEDAILDEVDEEHLINAVESKEELAQVPVVKPGKEKKNTDLTEKDELENYIMDNFEETDIL